MTVTRFVAIDQIHRRSDARPLDDETVAALADSIAEVGLLNPIRVRLRSDNDYELIAGSHRLAACDALDHREIFCVVVTDNDLLAELAMIDENLVRAELSPADRARQTARRKAIYETLHPETRHDAFKGNQHQAGSRQVGDNQTAPRFTADTAARTGLSERSVQRDAERGEKVCAEALGLVHATKLNTGSYLDKLKKLPANKQVAMVKAHLAGVASQPAPAVDPAASFVRFLDLADRIEELGVDDLVEGSGRRRATLGQRAAGLAERMGLIMEAVSR